MGLEIILFFERIYVLFDEWFGSIFSARNIPTIFDESKTFRILISCYCHGFMAVFFCWVYVTQQASISTTTSTSRWDFKPYFISSTSTKEAEVELRQRFVLLILVVNWTVVVGLGFHEWRDCGSIKGMKATFGLLKIIPTCPYNNWPHVYIFLKIK